MDDVIKLVATADLEALTKFTELIYSISQFDAHGWEYEPVEHPATAAIIEAARRRHWDSLEARRALAEQEPEVPDWLRAAQGPPDLDNKKGIGL